MVSIVMASTHQCLGAVAHIEGVMAIDNCADSDGDTVTVAWHSNSGYLVLPGGTEATTVQIWCAMCWYVWNDSGRQL